MLLAMVTYLDRVCISKLAPEIMRDLGLSKIQMGYVFSSFALAYALFEIPTAWWADREGTRRVLTRIVLWWSSFTIATAAAYNYAVLLVIRFLFGAGEAGAWPCVARTFGRWIPARERGTVQGVFFAGAHLAGGLTPLAVVALQPHLHWRLIFVCFGLVGFLWAAAWSAWFRDDPTEHPKVNAAELEHIIAERPPDSGHVEGWAYWGRLLRDPTVLALCGHVCLEQLDILLLYYVAADVSARATRLRCDKARFLCRPAAARQRAERSFRRRRDRQARCRGTGSVPDAVVSARSPT